MHKAAVAPTVHRDPLDQRDRLVCQENGAQSVYQENQVCETKANIS